MILNYRSQRQILDFWCWAAITSSVSYFFNHNQEGYSQSGLAGALIDSSCSAVNSGNRRSAPPDCNTPYDLALSLQYSRNYAGETPHPLAFNLIVQQINHFFPVCCQIIWDGNGDQSHFVTIYGYEGNRLVIGDPQATEIYSLDYYDFLNYRGGNWVRTIITQHP